MRQELLELLLTDSALALLIPARNIEWGRSSQGARPPRIVLSQISTVRDYHLQGASSYIVDRVQIDIYAGKYEAVQAIGNAVISILSGYHGGSLLGVFIDNERDLSGLESGDTEKTFRQSIDLIVHHRRS